MYGLADCNTFYASCEKAFKPHLIARPVVVLSNNDGCVIALSKEAKALGIVMGTPYFKVKELCALHSVVQCSSNYELYADMSNRVMETLKELAPKVEVYSIDEAFLDFDRMAGVDVPALARHIRATVTRNTGIPVSVGLAQTKTLAKAANRYAKRHTKDFAWALDTDEERERVLRGMDTQDVWGIGRRRARQLSALGVYSAWDFANCDSRMVRKKFSVVGQRVLWELQGTRCIGLLEEKPKKEIICSRAFGKVVYHWWELEQAIAKYVARAAEKLRAQQGFTQSIRVYIEGSNRFKDNRISDYGVEVRLHRPTSNTGEMIRASVDAAYAIYTAMPRNPNPFDVTSGFRKAGVTLTDITWMGHAQTDLFTALPSAKNMKAMQVMDELNRRFGRDTMFHAAQGINTTWKMRREYKSPNYTTRLADIPTVHC
ncbi:MAG: Y-family DNA polymerase [Rickettsiales bacterium]